MPLCPHCKTTHTSTAAKLLQHQEHCVNALAARSRGAPAQPAPVFVAAASVPVFQGRTAVQAPAEAAAAVPVPSCLSPTEGIPLSLARLADGGRLRAISGGCVAGSVGGSAVGDVVDAAEADDDEGAAAAGAISAFAALLDELVEGEAADDADEAGVVGNEGGATYSIAADVEGADGSGGLGEPPAPRRPLFDVFREAVRAFAAEKGSVFFAELKLLQHARRRDLSQADCEGLMKILTNDGFVASAYGPGAVPSLPTSWRSITNLMRELLRHLGAFTPCVVSRFCEVRTGPADDAHTHSARVAFLQGNKAWAFMLLDIELFNPKGLVRPPTLLHAGLHPSWADFAPDGGAGHPSFASLTLAREATVRAAHPHATLCTVPMGLVVSVDGTSA
jgi:hypothetical protein